jgi:hypothetical protein
LEEKLKVGRKEKDLDLVIEKRREGFGLSDWKEKRRIGLVKIYFESQRSWKEKLGKEVERLLKEKKLKLKQ